jgi:uncharacterized Zn ribbon protein
MISQGQKISKIRILSEEKSFSLIDSRINSFKKLFLSNKRIFKSNFSQLNQLFL